MHKNTFILLIILAVFAAIVVGVNIGKKLSYTPTVNTEKNSEQSINTLESTVLQKNEYSNEGCGVVLPIPDDYTLTNEASLSALFTHSDKNQTILLACQKDIPRPPIPQEYIESITLVNRDKTSTISAKLYHDQSPKDGEKLDALIYYNPKIKMDVFVAGFGPEFDEMLDTLRLLQ